MEVKWLIRAVKNLDDEATSIAQEDPATARAIVHSVVNAINLQPQVLPKL